METFVRFWTLVTCCSAKFHATILTEGIILPITGLGYKPENHKWELPPSHANVSPPEDMAAFALFRMSQETPSTLCFRSAREDDAPYRPGAASVEGGGGAFVRLDSLRSVELAPNSKVDLTPLNGSFVLGLGWDPLRNKTYEMIHGAGAPPDIDVCVYAVRGLRSMLTADAQWHVTRICWLSATSPRALAVVLSCR